MGDDPTACYTMKLIRHVVSFWVEEEKTGAELLNGDEVQNDEERDLA